MQMRMKRGQKGREEGRRTLAALMSSSARHSAMVLTLRKAASREPVQRSQMAWLTRRSGDTSTACRRTVPARPIRVESSRGPLNRNTVVRGGRGEEEGGWTCS